MHDERRSHECTEEMLRRPIEIGHQGLRRVGQPPPFEVPGNGNIADVVRLDLDAESQHAEQVEPARENENRQQSQDGNCAVPGHEPGRSERDAGIEDKQEPIEIDRQSDSLQKLCQPNGEDVVGEGIVEDEIAVADRYRQLMLEKLGEDEIVLHVVPTTDGEAADPREVDPGDANDEAEDDGEAYAQVVAGGPRLPRRMGRFAFAAKAENERAEPGDKQRRQGDRIGCLQQFQCHNDRR